MIRKTLITAILAVMSASAVAAVSPDEAAQLGKTLTPIGAEKAGNKDGTIPEWTGGLTAAPAGFKAGSTVRPDPYAGDKPRLVITGQNADQYKDQLTAVTYAMLKRHATMRWTCIRRVVRSSFPQRLVENTLKNADQAKTVEGGLGIDNALPGYPFPVPKTGNEVMWNHLLRYNGVATSCKYDSYNIGRLGRRDTVEHGQQLPGIRDLPPGEPRQADEGHGSVPEPQGRVQRSRAPRRRGSAR